MESVLFIILKSFLNNFFVKVSTSIFDKEIELEYIVHQK